MEFYQKITKMPSENKVPEPRVMLPYVGRGAHPNQLVQKTYLSISKLDSESIGTSTANQS